MAGNNNNQKEPIYLIAPDGQIHTRTSCMFCGLSMCVCDVELHIHEIHPEILHLPPTCFPAFSNTVSEDKQILAVTSLEWNPSTWEQRFEKKDHCGSNYLFK